MLSFSTLTHAEMIDDAIIWMYHNNYTIYNTRETFKPTRLMRRDEAAKFFVTLAHSLDKKEIKFDQECQFYDLNEWHRDLKDIMIESCKLGIFKGYQGRFMPTDNLTNAQTLALLVRILSWYEDESNVEYRADNYYNKANTRLWFVRFGEFYDKEWYTSRWLLSEVLYHLHLGKIVTHEPVSLPLTWQWSFETPTIFTWIIFKKDTNIKLTDFSNLRLIPSLENWSKSFEIVDIQNKTTLSFDLPGARTSAGFIARAPIYIGQQFNSSGYTYIGANRYTETWPGNSDYRLFEISYTGAVKQIAYLPFDTMTADFYYLPDRNIIYYTISSKDQSYQYIINTNTLEKISKETLKQYQKETQTIQKALDPTFDYLTKNKKECDWRLNNCVLWTHWKYYNLPETRFIVYPIGNNLFYHEHWIGQSIYKGIIDISFLNSTL